MHGLNQNPAMDGFEAFQEVETTTRHGALRGKMGKVFKDVARTFPKSGHSRS